MKKRIVLLIGATGGIGKALLATLNFYLDIEVIPTYRKSPPEGAVYNWIEYDTCDFEMCEKKLFELSQKYSIDMIIDASGAFFASKISESSVQEIRNVIETNLTAPLLLARSANKYLNEGGKLIFLSSVVSQQDLFGSSAYAASKIGLEKSVTTLAKEFSANGQSICAIRLGYMNYGMTFKIKEELRLKIQSALPRSNFMEIDVLAELIQYITVSQEEVNGKVFDLI